MGQLIRCFMDVRKLCLFSVTLSLGIPDIFNI